MCTGERFCSFEGFVTSEQLNSSSLTKIRKRLGPKFVKALAERIEEIDYLVRQEVDARLKVARRI